MCARFLELPRDSRESFSHVSLASSPQLQQKEEGPDLLDSLIQQDRQERAVKVPLTLPSLENLLKLLELQAASERLEARGRAITGGGGRAGEAWQPGREEQVMRHMASLHYSPAFPPLNLKLPPPGHPPAVPYSPMPSPYSSAMPSPYSSPLPSPSYSPVLPPRPGSPTSLYFRLEEVSLQLRALERERKRAEAALARQRPGYSRLLVTCREQGGAAARLPPSPSRLDKLLVDSWREHARVSGLLERMARLAGAPLHPNITKGVAGWQEAVVALQGLRRRLVGDERADSCLEDCSRAVRRVRTSLWAALQATTISTTETSRQ